MKRLSALSPGVKQRSEVRCCRLPQDALQADPSPDFLFGENLQPSPPPPPSARCCCRKKPFPQKLPASVRCPPSLAAEASKKRKKRSRNKESTLRGIDRSKDTRAQASPPSTSPTMRHFFPPSRDLGAQQFPPWRTAEPAAVLLPIPINSCLRRWPTPCFTHECGSCPARCQILEPSPVGAFHAISSAAGSPRLSPGFDGAIPALDRAIP